MQSRKNYQRDDAPGNLCRKGDDRPTENRPCRCWGSTGVSFLFGASIGAYSNVHGQPGVPAGDVVFVLHTLPHASFERSGNDLLAHITITLSEALLGFSRLIITHLDGRGVKLTTPPGKIIKAQESIVIRGEGMPVYKQPQEKGDLYVIFDIEMPSQDWLQTVDLKVCKPLKRS